MCKSLYFKKFYSLVLLLTTLISSSNAFAQTKRGGGQVASTQSKQSAPKCSGAWTGTITYTRTQNMTNNKTVERVSGRGKDTTDWQMKYDYKATVSVIESPDKNGSSLGKATIDHKFSSIEKTSAVEKKLVRPRQNVEGYERRINFKNRN